MLYSEILETKLLKTMVDSVTDLSFTKDLNSLIVQMERIGVNADMFKEVWKYNKEIRKVIDWTVT